MTIVEVFFAYGLKFLVIIIIRYQQSLLDLLILPK